MSSVNLNSIFEATNPFRSYKLLYVIAALLGEIVDHAAFYGYAIIINVRSLYLQLIYQ
jgi:hypothetical protein